MHIDQVSTLNIKTILGLILVPNGKLIGKQFGDRYPREDLLLEDHTNRPGGRLSGLLNNSTITQGNMINQ